MKEYNPYSLSGKRVLVTGASSGIGEATALECALLGANVVVTGRNEARLQAVYDALDRSEGQQHQMVVADLATDEGLDALVAEVADLDGVVSNAGIGSTSLVKFIKKEDLQRVWDINAVSHVMLAKLLFKKKKLNKGASYVFTASAGGIKNYVLGNGGYGMTKAAIDAFMKFAAVEFSSRAIRCNSVCPSMIETPMTLGPSAFTQEDYERNKEHYLLKRYGKPEEVARPIAFLLSDASSFITGISLVIDGGVTVSH